MKLVLTGRRKLEVRPQDQPPAVPAGETRLQVLYCAICRTDAKMWARGHRDLVLPRVPGHEIVAADEQGRRYAVWPGRSCGRCPDCRAGRENRCEEIKIIGFHRDGGFAREVQVPKTSLLPLPDTLASRLACFAEPLGCVLHGLQTAGIGAGERVVVLGGGTMGLLAGMALVTAGSRPVILEKDPAKIERARSFLDEAGVECVARISQERFAAAITACPDPAAFGQGLEKLAKGGRFCFFSGLAGEQHLSTAMVNQIHYRELVVSGSYGLNRSDMNNALVLLNNNQRSVKRLIQAVAPPAQVPEVLDDVLSGRSFRYIIDFTY
ncbi:MAG: zinc-dependent alcohol dehydrogenase [Desulfosudaceae bacterium]